MNDEYLNTYVKSTRLTYFAPSGKKWKSEIDSLSFEDHVVQLSEALKLESLDDLSGGYFSVFYEGKRMFAGDGPSISKEFIRLALELDATIEQDIYCCCS